MKSTLLACAIVSLCIAPAAAQVGSATPMSEGKPAGLVKGDKKQPQRTPVAPISPGPHASASVLPPPANDGCGSAQVIAGSGPFAFDLTQATTGAEGQANGACVFFGLPGIDADVWYQWTASSTGTAVIKTCGLTTVDTKIAVYAGAGCAAAATSAIACGDDACGPYQTQVNVAVTNGSTYLIQLGTYPGAVTGTGSFSIQVSAPPTNDNCATPVIISGNGTFNFNNSQAAAGSQGQNNAACNFYTLTAIDNDVWFRWTAPSSGVATVSLCGLTSIDSKVAAYSGAGCPVGAPLACNDDQCGYQSRISFPCTAAGVYTIQLGTYPGEPGTVATFTIQVTQPATNDDCTSATVISGPGTFAFDNSLATTGVQGQSSLLCDYFGATGIKNDVWFRWTSTSTGQASVSLCNQAFGLDSKVAVYSGTTCPSGQAIACNDDACGLESKVCWNATSGASYIIQIGTYPNSTGAPGTTGTFNVAVSAPPGGCRYDDGVSDNSVGLNGGGAVLWLQRFGTTGNNTRITSVSTAWGSAAFPGNAPPNGTAARIGVWDDPNDDGDPTDAVLISQVTSTVQNVDTDTLVRYALPSSALMNGVFFVGASVVHGVGEFPAPLDSSICNGSMGRAWVAGDTSGTINFNALGANDVPPVELDAMELPGVWLLRTDCCGTVGFAFCFGDGSPVPCPCVAPNTVPSPASAPGSGCANSFNLEGAKLCATGTTNPDTVELVSMGQTTVGFGFFIAASAQLPLPMASGDGLLCIGGTIIRFGSQNAVGGVFVYPNPPLGWTLPLHSINGITLGSGQAGYYQTFYRNAIPNFCNSQTSNRSSAVLIQWN